MRMRVRFEWSHPGQWPQLALMALVHAYRLLLKPWLGNACRFEPSCSQYALDALERHGALAGSALAGARLLRCHPWCHGGLDPVPSRPPAFFTRLGLGEDPGPKHRNPS
jgi:putative membrane protein insertion efficiency factor